jgi:hypothetical protein
MSVKLVFQDGKGNALHDKDIIYDGSAPLPEKGEDIQLPGGLQATVKSRQFVYSDSKRETTDVQIVFVCKRDKKHTGGTMPLKEF